LPPGSTATLTSTTNKDVAGTAFVTQIYDLTSQQRIALCAGGTTCSAAVNQLALTTHSYQAFVASPATSPPPPNVAASSSVVSVTWSPLPDPSRPANVGGGAVSGAVTFASPGVPPSGQPCRATSFAFNGASDSAWLNAAITAYVGPITITGSGGSPCETATSGSGPVTLSASGSNPLGSTLSCPSLVGNFTRVLTDVTVVVSGDCRINDFPTFSVQFLAHGEFVPTNDGAGVTAPVLTATFAGAFAISPA
jgi:hypothetical protein